MISRRIAVLLSVTIVGIASAALLSARGQTVRPGDMTPARVWVENRTPGEAVPVIVQSAATPLTVHLDSSSAVQTVAARQTWEYRSIPLASGADPARGLAGLGAEGWEAVGVVLSNQAGATILLKRPR